MALPKKARAKVKRAVRRAARPNNMGPNEARMRGLVARTSGNAAGAHQTGIRGRRDRAGAKRAALNDFNE